MMIVRPMIVRPMMVVRLSGHPLIRDSLSEFNVGYYVLLFRIFMIGFLSTIVPCLILLVLVLL